MTDLLPVSERAEGPTVLGDERSRWLRARRELITASDVAAILGEDQRRGPLVVWAEKVHGLESDDTPWTRRGRRMEPVIAAEYAEVTERRVFQPEAFEIVRHPDVPWLGATLDRRTAGSVKCPPPPGAAGLAPLELKAVGTAHAREWDDDDDEAPVGYEIQLQIQIDCDRASWGSLVALVGLEAAEPTVRDRRRDPAFLQAALPALERFWALVQAKEQPDADGLTATTALVRRLWNREGRPEVVLDHHALDLADRWESAKWRRGLEDDVVAELDNRLRQRMGDAAWGALPDGTFLKLIADRAGRRSLKRWRPRVRRR